MELTKLERFSEINDKIIYNTIYVIVPIMFILMIYIVFSNFVFLDKFIGLLLTGFILVGSIRLRGYLK